MLYKELQRSVGNAKKEAKEGGLGVKKVKNV